MQRTMTLALLFSLLCLLATPNVFGRSWLDSFEGEINGMPYRYFLPADYDESIEYLRSPHFMYQPE